MIAACMYGNVQMAIHTLLIHLGIFFNTFARTCHNGHDDIKPKNKIIEVKNRY